MPRTFPSVAECLRVIRALDRTNVKLAELGGDGGDVPFEQAFSNLAHAYLRDKAPSLLDHELGFQLLDRNQENTKAVGVFGFKVGSSMLYAPVFFLQGDLKGHELLYIKNQDMFVPMKENWLNYILNRKPNILGEGTDRNTAQLGVMQPDLNRLSKSPWKYGSAMPAWAKGWLPKMAHTSFTDVSKELDQMGRDMHLPTFCKQASLSTLDVLVKTCQKFPALGAEIIKHHGDLSFLHAAVKTAASRSKVASVLDAPRRPAVAPIFGSVLDEPAPIHPIKKGSLKVINHDVTVETELPEGLDEADAEKLLEDGILIKDEREGEEVSVAYNVQVEKKLFNPPESGVYYVLVKPGEFRECYVIHSPHGPDGRVEFSTLVDLEDDGKRRWVNIHPSRIWAVSKIDESLQPKTYKDVLEGLPEATNESIKAKSGRKCLIGPRGDGTLPFRVKEDLGDTDGGVSMTVDFSTHADYRYSEPLNPPTRRYDAYYDGSWVHGESYDKYSDGQRVHFDATGGTGLRSTGGDMYIPKGFKILELELEEYESDSESESSGDGPCGCSFQSMRKKRETSPLRPGTFADVQLAIWNKTAGMRVKRAGSGFTLNGQQMTLNQSLTYLVAHHGLREIAARTLLKQAQVDGVIDVRIKHANPYLTQGAPTAPGFPGPEMGTDNMMGFPGPTQSMSEHSLPVDGMQAQMGNRALYDPRPEAVGGGPMEASTIQNAMQSGQREVFDTAMLGSMLKAVRDDTMIDRYLPKLVEGMDRLGRILFMFYWHGDKFADRYGKQDMPELEDSLRNAFEMIGDVILFLKQKTIEPYPEEDNVSLDLAGAAN